MDLIDPMRRLQKGFETFNSDFWATLDPLTAKTPSQQAQKKNSL